MTLAPLLANAAALGAAYALMAIGFVLVLNAVGAVNFAHGDWVVAGGFATVLVAGVLPLPAILLLPLVIVAMMALGLLCGLVAYLPLRDRPPTAVFVSTIAVGIVIQQGLTAAFGAAPRATPALLGEGAAALPWLGLSGQQAATLAAAAVLIGGLAWLLERTRLGRWLRASAQDPEIARSLGIPVTAMTLASFAAAAGLAGAAGLMTGHELFLTPTDGGQFMLKAYIAVTIGGWGRIGGAAVGALVIAAFEVVGAALVSYVWAEAALYATLLLVLAFRPQGLLGEAARVRA
ncbi:MAG: branched-chain amino acid ABC transporter permease [Alphaproteobacteria bacterium]